MAGINKSDGFLLELLKASYQDVPLSMEVKEEDLSLVVKTAEAQGVVGLVFDALSKLPKEKIYYSKAYHKAMSAFMKMEEKYPAYRKAIEDLGAFFHENGFQMLLFKGEDMRRNWMKPELRPVGDVDIFLYYKKDEDVDVDKNGSESQRVKETKSKEPTNAGGGNKEPLINTNLHECDNKTTEDSEYTENMSGSSVSSVVENNINASVVGDLLVRDKLGIPVTKSKVGHHSHICFQGQSVENHYEFSNTYFGGERTRRLEKCLQDLACGDASLNTNYHECTTNFHELDVDKTTDTGGVNKKTLINTNLHESNLNSSSNYSLPSANFNAIFLMWHLSTHFCTEAVSLRQLYDWLMFIRVHHFEIDWTMVEAAWEAAGMKKFAEGINGLLIKYLGADKVWFPDFNIDEALSDRILNDILHGPRREAAGIWNIFHYIKSNWKYKICTGHSWVRPTMQSAWMHIVHCEDLVEKEV